MNCVQTIKMILLCLSAFFKNRFLNYIKSINTFLMNIIIVVENWHKYSMDDLLRCIEHTEIQCINIGMPLHFKIPRSSICPSAIQRIIVQNVISSWDANPTVAAGRGVSKIDHHLVPTGREKFSYHFILKENTSQPVIPK